ncbi:DUF4250 domain-containing protein [Cellulosilyticum sp. ST5]|uniref:DUF4250 domain-containing protein n=1 Tax=unclassified Cellulosilyticum TaxID=2643091 RepID=UPI000F8C33A3|nr:DUF4250 domain-containing protein [Cellulosilyticum sp. WCF-2]QEH68655.1 DUF4250 domain-containing protein [Cellulosilyticum sp. WCF-2]
MLNKKDPYLLLSIVNMKLRDEADSLTELCKSYDKNQQELEEQLLKIGYHYEKKTNQFIAV